MAKKTINQGKRLFKLRSKLGLSQRQMAAELMVSPGAIAHWEQGNRVVPGPVIKLMGLFESKKLVPSKKVVKTS